MNFEQYVRGNELHAPSSSNNPIDIGDLITFLQSSSTVKHLILSRYQDVSNLAAELRKRPPYALLGLERLSFKGQLAVGRKATGSKIVESLAKFLVEISKLNEHLIIKLDLDYHNISLTAIRALANVQSLSRIKELSLSNINIGIEGIKTLAGSRNLQDLKYLDLSGNQIGDDGIKVLAESQYLSKLEHLNLRGCGIVNAEVLTSYMANLKQLNLSENRLSQSSLEKLAQHMLQLEHLSLRNCNIVNAEAIVQMPNLKQLDLSSNTLSQSSLEKLAQHLQLEHLSLRDCKIVNAEAIARMPNLKHLDITLNELSASSIAELVERKLDYLSIKSYLTIKPGEGVTGDYDTKYKKFCELIIAVQSARDAGRVPDAVIIKAKIFDIAAFDRDGEIVKYILNQRNKYPFLVNSRSSDGHSLLRFYTHHPAMQVFLFSSGMVPEAEEVIGRELQNLVTDEQSVHKTISVTQASFFTTKLVESIRADKAQLGQAADSYAADIPKFLNLYQSDQVRIGLLSIIDQDRKSVMEKTPHLYTQDDKIFIATVAEKVKKTLKEKYLTRDKDGKYGSGFPSFIIRYNHDNQVDSQRFITIPEVIGYVKLMIDRAAVTLAERKELLVTLAAQNPGLVEAKLHVIKSELGSDDIFEVQQDGDVSPRKVSRTKFHSLIRSIADNNKIDGLFKQISGLDIQETRKEQKEFVLLKQLYVAATTYGQFSSGCPDGIWKQVVASVGEIDDELAKQCHQHLAEQRKLEEKRAVITEEKGKEVAEFLARKLVEYVKKRPELKDALERLVDNIIDTADPEKLTQDQQELLSALHIIFIRGMRDGTIRRILGDDYRRLPKNGEYQMIVNGFLGNEEINIFFELEKVSERIKDFDEQGQIARNREALTAEVKTLIESFTENSIDINTKNSEGETLLHLAARIGDKSLVSDLLSRGANFNIQNKNNLMPKDLSRVDEVSQLLVNVEQAFLAADVDDFVRLRSAIQNSGDVPTMTKVKNKDGHTLFYLLIFKMGTSKENIEIAEETLNFLIKNGADVNVQGPNGLTFLYLAVANKEIHPERKTKQLEIISLSLDNGADINFKDTRGNSPLYIAVSKANKEVVDILLERGAVIDDAIMTIARGMATLPSIHESDTTPNKVKEDSKAILEQLEQHKLGTSGCVQPGGRAKRAAISCRLPTDEYIEMLRELPIQEQIRFTQANEIEFIGPSEIKRAEKVRDLLLADDTTIEQKSYEVDKLLENPKERRIIDLSGNSQSKSPILKQRLMNAAGGIQLLRGIHGTFASCESGDLRTDCTLSVVEIGFSFFSQLIENGMLKITPRVVKSAANVAGKVPFVGKNFKFAIQLKGIGSGKVVARGVAGGITGVFDIVDIGMSANTLINCASKQEGEEPCGDKEVRDSIAGITFGSVSFISGVAFTALAMSGVGTAVGLTLMVAQGVYSGVSNIIEYEEKYDTTHNENGRILWNTFTFQDMPKDVQDLAARKEIDNQLAKEVWERLENSTDIAAIAMGLGSVAFKTEIVGRKINDNVKGSFPREIKDGKGCTWFEQGIFPRKTCSNITVEVPYVLPSHASIIMNETNADTSKLARIIPNSPSPEAKMLGLPKWLGVEAYEYNGERTDRTQCYSHDNCLIQYERIPYYSTNREAIYPCNNAFIIANKTRTANSDNQSILFDLRYVNQGEFVGSNEMGNIVLVHGENVQIFGGNNVKNQFHLMNGGFSGGIYGGDNATNILDLSHLNGVRITYKVFGIYSNALLFNRRNGWFSTFSTEKINLVIGRKCEDEIIECRDNKEIFVNSGGGSSNDQKDLLDNCKKAVISPYTQATGGDGKYIFYVQPGVGHSVIDVSGSGTLIFSETALLNDCNNITYSSNSNTLSFEIPLGEGKTFVLDVKNYLNADKTPKFHLIDKHGSNIVPVIRESGEVKSFRLNAERAFTNTEEDEDWYRRVSQSRADYQIFGVIQDKQFKTNHRVFGSSGVDVINMNAEVVFAHGGNKSDLYSFDGNSSNQTIVIDNYAEDQELDVLLIQQHSVVAHKIGDDLRLHELPHVGETTHRVVKVKNYFKDLAHQHLIIQKDADVFIPLNIEGAVCLVPFYHASNSENVFFLPENSTEIVIDAKIEDIEFYRYKGDLLLTRDKDDNTATPLTIVARGFYSNPSNWQNVKPYFWNNGEFSSFDLSQKAAEAVSYKDKIKSDYRKTVKEYIYSDTFSREITHNQQRLENGTLTELTEDEQRIGVLIFKDIDPSRIGLVYTGNDLILFDKSVDHQNLTIHNWNASEDHRISRIEFDLELGQIVIRKLDRFDLSAEGAARIQHLLSNAAVNSEIAKRLEESDIENNFQCLITMYKINNTYRCLGFLTLEDQINFAKAYCNSHKLNAFTEKVLEDDGFASLLRQFVIKLYNNLLLNGYDRDEVSRCSNITLYTQFASSSTISEGMQSIRNVTNTMNSEIQSQFSTTTVSPEASTHRRRHHHAQNATAKQRNRRNIGKNMEEENIPSSASRSKSWINDLFGWVKSSIGGLFNSRGIESSTANLPNTSQVGAQVDLNGTILLLDTFIRKITGQKYISVNHNVSLSEVQVDALNTTEKLKEVISQTPAEEWINLAEVQSNIFKAMMSGNGNRVPEILRSCLTEACLKCKDNNKLLTRLKNSLEEVLVEKEDVFSLNRQQDNISPSQIPEETPAAKLSKENRINTLLNGTSIAKQLSYAESLGLKSGVRIG